MVKEGKVAPPVRDTAKHKEDGAAGNPDTRALTCTEPVAIEVRQVFRSGS